MHPYLSEALAKMRIDDLHREATLYRRAHEVDRHRPQKGVEVSLSSHQGIREPCRT